MSREPRDAYVSSSTPKPAHGDIPLVRQHKLPAKVKALPKGIVFKDHFTAQMQSIQLLILHL